MTRFDEILNIREIVYSDIFFIITLIVHFLHGFNYEIVINNRLGSHSAMMFISLTNNFPDDIIQHSFALLPNIFTVLITEHRGWTGSTHNGRTT